MPESTEDVLVDVLHGLEVLGASTAAMVAGVDRQTGNIDRLAEAIAHRPTNRALVGVLVVVAVLLALIWLSLSGGQRYIRQQVEMGDAETKVVVCGLLSDVRSYHNVDPTAPGCPTTTTTGPASASVP